MNVFLPFLENTDKSLFLLFYNFPHPFFLNIFFGIVSAVGSYGMIWVLMAILSLRKKGEILRFFLAFFCLTAVCFWLQNFTARFRPYEVLEGVRYLGFIDPGGFSFPSYHAATSFFGAVVMSHKFKKYKGYFFILAAFISFSRIYLGAHYLTDILAGAIIGIVVAKVVINYGRRANRHSFALF
jgi:undecaprenyl-diphosphatase